MSDVVDSNVWVDGQDSSAQGKLALIAAVLLGITAVLTAWSAYRSSLTGDLVLKNYSEQQATLALANDAYIRSGQERQAEWTLFLDFAILANAGNEDAANYLFQVMSPELTDAVVWWSETPDDENSPSSPFVEENPTFADLPSEVLWAEAVGYDDEADALRLAAEQADADSDRFDLANVFFATVLFIAGLTTIVQRRIIQIGFLALASLGLVAGAVLLATTPGAFALG